MNRLTIFLLITLPILFACTQKEQEVRVESVSINQSSVELEIGQTLQLNATVSPSTATRKDITWSSSKSSVASVSSSGLVTAVSEGTTTITASADGKKGECTVSVVKKAIAVSEIKLDKTELTLYEGEEETLTASVLSEDATDKTVTWTSSDKSIVSVESGKVKAVGKGEATITAKAGEKTAEAKVIVLTPISGLSLNKDQVTLYIGETETLEATLSPADATLKDPISWSSSNESIAKVDGGKITAIGKGTAKITATGGGKSASCTIEVLRPVSGISLNKTELELPLDGSETLTVSIIPSDATPREDIKWSSSNTNVATVDDGKVTAIKGGIATITASVDGYKADCSVIVTMEYGAIAITDLKPVDIMPVMGKVTGGDRQVYDHIEHLRIAEATRIREMMSKYGAGTHSGEEYQQLLGRLVVGMSMEVPPFPNTYEVVGRGFGDLETYGNGHSTVEWGFLNLIVPNTRRIVEINSFYDAEIGGWYNPKPEQIDYINMESFLTDNPNSIVILARSAAPVYYDCYHEHDNEDANLREFCRSGRLIFFKSGGNVDTVNGILINKCFHKDVETDGHGLYSTQSMANGKADAKADMALLVSIGTDRTGDIDQTGYIYESSVFPVGFHDKVLFAGRTLPILKDDGTYSAYTAHYATSYANYYNSSIMSLCFQLYAEAKDAFELLDMVRATCLTDYIRLDGQTQPLQLINPAGLYKKYLTPQNLPTAISPGETISLDKGYYKGILFSIPGAEVKINDEWVAFDNKNKEVILSQNPMNLEWRLNGELLKKYGYTSGQTVEGQIITVDDKWGGLRLEIPMTIHVR